MDIVQAATLVPAQPIQTIDWVPIVMVLLTALGFWLNIRKERRGRHEKELAEAEERGQLKQWRADQEAQIKRNRKLIDDLEQEHRTAASEHREEMHATLGDINLELKRLNGTVDRLQGHLEGRGLLQHAEK